MERSPNGQATQRHRLHPASLLFILGAQVKSFIVPGLFVLLVARRSEDPAVWAMVLVVPYTVAAVVRYFTTRYSYRPQELVVESGVLFRDRRHVPYARIHNLRSIANPVHRALGVAEVRVETAGGQEPEAVLRVLSQTALDEMRRRVAAAKEGRVEAGASRESEPSADPAAASAPLPAAPPARDLVRLSPGDLVVYGLVDNRGMVVVAAAAGVAWQAGLLDRIERTLGDLWDRAGTLLEGLGATPVRVAVAVALALAVLVAGMRVLSLAWAFVKLWGFRLSLAGRELATESGLFTRVASALPLHRIQTVTVVETPLLRLFERVRVTAEIAGGGAQPGQGGDGEGGGERPQLAPVLRREALPALVADLLPGLDLAAVEWRPVDPRGEARMRLEGLIAAAIVGVLATGASLAFGGWPWWGVALAAPLAALEVLLARRRVRRLGWAVTEDAVLYRSGGLWRRTTVARCSKIQTVALAESPFDRRWGMATLRLDTAGAAATGHRLHVPYLTRATARDLADLLGRRAATTAFRW